MNFQNKEDQVEALSKVIELMLLDSENFREIQSEIKEKLNQERDLIDDLVAEDEERYGYLYYSYHTRNALFLSRVGKEIESQNQEKRSLKYANSKKPDGASKKKEEAKEEIDSASSKKKLGDFFAAAPDPKNEELLKIEAEALAKLEQLPDKIFKELIKMYKMINNFQIRSFNEYQTLRGYEKTLKTFVLEISVERTYEDYHEQVQLLEMIAKKKCEKLRNQFAQAMLVCSDLREELFGDISLTEENINRRYKQLGLYFHPDKCSEESRSVFNKFFSLITQCKMDLLETMKKETAAKGQLAYFEEKGNTSWGIALDIQKALKGEFGNMKLLKRESISHLSQGELKDLRLQHLRGALEAYRVCCRIADKNQIFKKQLEFRGYLALCFYASNQLLEAKMCALATICLVLNSSQAIDEDLSKANAILRKVNQEEVQVPATSHAATSDALVLANQTALALIKKPLQQYSPFDRAKLKKSVKQLLANVERELVLKSDCSLVSYQASAEEILIAKLKAKTYMVAGAGTVAAGTVMIAAAGFAGSLVVWPIGLVTIGLGIWNGVKLFQKGNDMREEPQIREKLNDILAKAVQLHDEGKYQEFFTEVSKVYHKKKRLFVFEKPSDVIDPNEIIDTLLSHGFRPDGIAYLLNLIGEALLSGKIVIQASPTEIRGVAKKLFFGSDNSKLRESAKKLDERAKELEKNSRKIFFSKVCDTLFLKDYSDLAEENLRDSKKMPFHERLEEMRNIADLNIAVIYILDEEIDEAKNYIQKVRNSVKESNSKSQTRLEVLEDFLWIMNGQPLDDDDIKATQTLPILQ